LIFKKVFDEEGDVERAERCDLGEGMLEVRCSSSESEPVSLPFQRPYASFGGAMIRRGRSFPSSTHISKVFY
jgi:hypothetical protein